MRSASSSSLKKGIRVIGIDETPFKKGDEFTTLVAVVARKGRLEDVITSKVHVDGDDSTDKIIRMIRKKYLKQGKVIMIHSITTAGMNIVDIERVSKELNCPVISITERRVHGNLIKQAIEKKFKHKLSLVKEMHKIGKYYVSYAGASEDVVRRLVKAIGFEPIRLAHVIARGIKNGDG